MKRKADTPKSSAPKKGKAAVKVELSDEEIAAAFRAGLFDEKVKKAYNEEYKSSAPYRHAVIQPLISDELLLSVKAEVLANLAFTPKETDIYRIHQSGDLANISGLPAELANKLPSLRRLRDAMYSKQFRDYVCAVTGCGALSGTKTDMAINVYTPGCHLLTHDDVIGSRRVSYILYLCGSPTQQWDPAWGGALRLYPMVMGPDGKTKVPHPDWSKVIPPAWNQLSFFEVVPGESFHDVEEVYDGPEDRIRMAISGWFHIPQPGEDGYIPGLEEELAKKSSLQSLQTKADEFDRPLPAPVTYPEPEEKPKEAEKKKKKDQPKPKGKGKAVAEAMDEDDDEEEEEEEEEAPFTEEELDFLLKYIAPTYLTPDVTTQMASHFADNSTIQLSDFLRAPFAEKVKAYIESHPTSTWPVAVPPHKQKFQYLQPSTSSANPDSDDGSPIGELVNTLFPSTAFRKLLQIISSGLTLTSSDVLARRFRRGLDYTLATALPSGMRLEANLCLTPPTPAAEKGKKVPKRHGPFDDSTRTTGGYEMYMAPDDDDEGDAAIYKAAKDDEDEDGVLWTSGVEWNTLSLVLRDTGVLRFVKYLSKSADNDRWDVVGEYEVEEADDDEEEAEDGDEGEDEDEDEDEDEGEDAEDASPP